MISQYTVFGLIALCAVAYCRPDTKLETNAVIANAKTADKPADVNKIDVDIEKNVNAAKTIDKPKKRNKNKPNKALENNKTKMTPEVPPIVKVLEETKPPKQEEKPEISFGCNCGVFMSGQIPKGNKGPPNGNPVLMQEQDGVFACTPLGAKQCMNKCLDTIVRHLPNSPNILCSLMDRDCRKERAYLFVQNCHSGWTNTKLSAGREYCCQDGKPYLCPLI